MVEEAAYKNLFDKQSREYSRFRPRYPAELFEFLAESTPARSIAWDVGTGSGQAALALAEFFQKVLATDSSEAQIKEASDHERINYQLSPAEHCSLADSSCDLITVANALHWFDKNAFYNEAKRVLKNNGVLAVWCYSLLHVPEQLKPAVEDFYKFIEDYWPPPVKELVLNGHRYLDFPFLELEAPELSIDSSWHLEGIIGFYSSWSAVQIYKNRKGSDPLERLKNKIRECNIPVELLEQPIRVRLPLHIQIGRK